MKWCLQRMKPFIIECGIIHIRLQALVYLLSLKWLPPVAAAHIVSLSLKLLILLLGIYFQSQHKNTLQTRGQIDVLYSSWINDKMSLLQEIPTSRNPYDPWKPPPPVPPTINWGNFSWQEIS